MILREPPLYDVPGAEPRRLRDAVAELLRVASRALDRLALRLALVEPVAASEPLFEYHADAGAPEGALYVNGLLVGRLEGVTRL
jgi:hypothetical protein